MSLLSYISVLIDPKINLFIFFGDLTYTFVYFIEFQLWFKNFSYNKFFMCV